MADIVVVQQVRTIWTKKSRGGPGAVRRNVVPEACAIPLKQIPERGIELIHHEVTFREKDAFAKPIHKVTINTTLRPLAVGCVAIHIGADHVTMEFQYRADCAGAPNRGWAQRIIPLAIGEWGQIAYNGRFAPGWHGDWWYEKTVVNAAIVDHLSDHLFTGESPTYRYELFGKLI
jgi:hypothetical protein